MTTAVRTPPHHNTLTCYTDYQCRRPECVDRYNARNRERLQAQKAGTWTGLIDAEPVRQHILQLGAIGISPSDIAATADTSIQSVLEFIRPVPGRGRRHRTSPAMAARILAVGPDNVVRAVVDATATQRRLQALAALGWPMKHTALHAGLSTTNITSIFTRSRVTAATEQAIADAYDQMRRQRPENHRVSRGQAKKTRRWAAAAQLLGQAPRRSRRPALPAALQGHPRRTRRRGRPLAPQRRRVHGARRQTPRQDHRLHHPGAPPVPRRCRVTAPAAIAAACGA